VNTASTPPPTSLPFTTMSYALPLHRLHRHRRSRLSSLARSSSSGRCDGWCVLVESLFLVVIFEQREVDDPHPRVFRRGRQLKVARHLEPQFGPIRGGRPSAGPRRNASRSLLCPEPSINFAAIGCTNLAIPGIQPRRRHLVTAAPSAKPFDHSPAHPSPCATASPRPAPRSPSPSARS